MDFSDHLTLDAPKRTKDGFLAVRARAARTGVYDYLGSEIDPDNTHGLRDKGLVKVLRDEATVFDKSSAHSFIGKPITDNHPTEAVTADNWRQHARGTVMNAMRDGEFLAFDLLLTDAEAIRKVDAGKRELSNGYAADLEFGSFTAPDGTACVARQAKITGNHVALVDRGRAGSECAIKDMKVCDAMTADELQRLTASLTDRPSTGDLPMKTLTIDGLKVPNVSDEAEAAIIKLQANEAALKTKVTDAEAQVATLTTEKATTDAKVTTLEKQLEDAKLSPEQLRDAAKAYAQVVDKAKALGVTVGDSDSTEAIMKAAVSAKIGDASKDWTVDQIAASFATLTKDVKVNDNAVVNLSPARMTANDTSSIHSAAKSARAR